MNREPGLLLTSKIRLFFGLQVGIIMDDEAVSYKVNIEFVTFITQNV